jgi:hypothetical protein
MESLRYIIYLYSHDQAGGRRRERLLHLCMLGHGRLRHRYGRPTSLLLLRKNVWRSARRCSPVGEWPACVLKIEIELLVRYRYLLIGSRTITPRVSQCSRLA